MAVLGFTLPPDSGEKLSLGNIFQTSAVDTLSDYVRYIYISILLQPISLFERFPWFFLFIIISESFLHFYALVFFPFFMVYFRHARKKEHKELFLLSRALRRHNFRRSYQTTDPLLYGELDRSLRYDIFHDTAWVYFTARMRGETNFRYGNSPRRNFL